MPWPRATPQLTELAGALAAQLPASTAALRLQLVAALPLLPPPPPPLARPSLLDWEEAARFPPPPLPTLPDALTLPEGARQHASLNAFRRRSGLEDRRDQAHSTAWDDAASDTASEAELASLLAELTDAESDSEEEQQPQRRRPKAAREEALRRPTCREGGRFPSSGQVSVIDTDARARSLH